MRRGALARRVLRVGPQRELAALVDDLLHRGVDELIEGVELLADEALVLEEGRDDGPGVLLRVKFARGEVER